MATSVPPPFAERNACTGCGASFTLLTRRHHCRNCGESYCASCTPYSDLLPHYGFTKPERTCLKCHEYLNQRGASAGASTDTSSAASGSKSTYASSRGPSDDLFNNPALSGGSFGRKAETKDSEDVDEKEEPRVPCKCGMPLCVCAKQQASMRQVQANISRPTARPAAPAASTSSGPAPAQTKFMGFPSMTSSAPKFQIDPTQDINEQCREAIKNGNADAVRQLIQAKASMTWVDRSGNTLLHLACIMDKMPIITMLVEAGANPYIVNTQSSANETPYDVASPSVQFRLKQMVSPPESHRT